MATTKGSERKLPTLAAKPLTVATVNICLPSNVQVLSSIFKFVTNLFSCSQINVKKNNYVCTCVFQQQ